MLILKAQNVPLSGLVANQKCRFELLRFLNSNIKNFFKNNNFLELGQNMKYYDNNKICKVESNGSKFLILQGFKTSFEIYESGLKILIDFSSKILRCSNIWQEFLNSVNSGNSEDWTIEHLILGRLFMGMYGN